MASVLAALGERVDAMWRSALRARAFPSLSVTLRCPLPLGVPGPGARGHDALAIEATLQLSVLPLLLQEPQARAEAVASPWQQRPRSPASHRAGRRTRWTGLAQALREEARRELVHAWRQSTVPWTVLPDAKARVPAGPVERGGYPAQLLLRGDRLAVRCRALLLRARSR